MFEDLKGLILVIKYTLNPSSNAHPSLSMGCKGSSSNGMTMCIECKVIIHFTTGLLKNTTVVSRVYFRILKKILMVCGAV